MGIDSGGTNGHRQLKEKSGKASQVADIVGGKVAHSISGQQITASFDYYSKHGFEVGEFWCQ